MVCLLVTIASASASSLSGVPDVPHAAPSTCVLLPSNNAQDSSTGKSNPLSESKAVEEDELVECAKRGKPVKLTFKIKLTEFTEACWETLLHGHLLYIKMPAFLESKGSKEGFVALLEYAEEVLKCTDIIICMKKDRPDKAQLVRTFMYIGFTVLSPVHNLIPQSAGTMHIYMHYSII